MRVRSEVAQMRALGREIGVRPPERASILLCTGLLLAALVGVATAALGWSEEALRVVVRASARTSIVLFSLAFAASSLQALCVLVPLLRFARWRRARS